MSAVLNGKVAVLLPIFAAWAVRSGLAADTTTLWLTYEGDGDLCFRTGEGRHAMLNHHCSCAEDPVAWLPQENGTGKIQFKGLCLDASGSFLPRQGPSSIMDPFATWEACDSSQNPGQIWFLTEAKHLRLAALPAYELRRFRYGRHDTNLVYLAAKGNIVAYDGCTLDRAVGLRYGSLAIEVGIFKALCILMGLLLLIYTPLCIYNTWVVGAHCRRRARDVFVRARGALCSRARGGGGDPIRELVGEFRARRLARVARVFSIPGTAVLAILAWHTFPFFSFPPEEYDRRSGFTPRRILNETELIPHIISCLGMLAMYLSRGPKVLIVADALHICSSAGSLWHEHTVLSSIHLDDHDYWYSANWVAMSRIVMAVFLGNAKLTTVLNVFISAVERMILMNSQPSDVKAEKLLYYNLVLCSLVVTLAWLSELSAWHEAAARVEVQTSEHSEVLLSRLLSGLCDATVRLDQSLNIVQRAPKLACLLLRNAKAFGDLGVGGGRFPFMDIVHAEDRTLLRTHLDNGLQAGYDDITLSLNVRLLDSLGNAVPVMIVSSTKAPTSGTGTVCQMLGINMLTEKPLPGEPEDVLPLTGLAQREGLAPRPCTIGTSSMLSSVSSSASSDIIFSISFRAVGGCVTAAGCNRPEALKGKPYKDLVALGEKFQRNVWDQPGWVAEFNGTMVAVMTGETASQREMQHAHRRRAGPLNQGDGPLRLAL